MKQELISNLLPSKMVFLTPILDKYGAARTLFSVIHTFDQKGVPCEVWFPRDSKVEPEFLSSFSDLVVFRQMDLPVLRRKQVYEFHFLITLMHYLFNSFKIRKVTFSPQYANACFHIFTSASILGIFLVPRRNRVISVHEFSKNRFERLLLKFLFQISGSRRIFASRAVMSHYGIGGEIIHSGANIEIFRNFKKKLFEPGNTLNILCVGRITQTKGQLIVLKALAELLQYHQNFKAIFIGSPFGNVRDYMDLCIHFAKSNGLDNLVEFVGEKSDTREFYENSDLVIVPSIQPEAFGKVLIEGMASSNIVIATNIGGPLEIVQHEVNGLLVNPNSADQLRQAIEKIITGGYDLKRMTTNAKDSSKHFNDVETGRKYFEYITRRIL
ncbi:RfaG Glycosyltransferase [Candidatus Nanopelagicaceae bacterium]